jgi:lipopolysaccharide export system protein LptC
MKNFKVTLPSVLSAMTALIGTVLYLTQYSESGKLSIVDSFDAVPDADSHLTEIEGIKYAIDGRIAYKWRAKSAERLISDGSVMLSHPHYIGNIADQRPWTASAKSGQLAQDGQFLQLHRSVVVQDLIRQAQINTELLNINLDTSEVSTDQPLSLALRNGVTHSVGMQASLKNERVELLHQVTGHYEPL